MGGGVDADREVVVDGRRGAQPTEPVAPAAGRRWGGVDVVLMVAVVVGAALRLWGVTAQSLWFDEWSTGWASSGSLGDLGFYLRGVDGLPPPYFIGMWVWAHVFGHSVLALRAPSVIAGVATIAVMYATAQALGLPRRVARVVALLVAVNPMLVWYSQEARSYSLLVLFSALSLWAYAHVRTGGRDRDWRYWGLACVASVSVHYFGVFLVAAETVDLWRRRPEQRARILVALRPTAVVVAVLAPWVLYQQLRHDPQDWVGGFPLLERLYDWAVDLLIGPVPADGRVWLGALVVVTFAVAVLVARAEPAERALAGRLAAFGLTVVALPLAANVVGIDAVLSRYMIAATVPLVLVVAMGLGHRRAGWLGPVGVAVIVAVSVPTVVYAVGEPDLSKPDWDQVASVLESDGTADGTRVMVVSDTGYKALPLLDLLDGARELTGEQRARDVVEIDVLFGKATSHPCSLLIGLACSMVFVGQVVPAPVVEKVFLVERVELDQFVIERYGIRVPSLSVTRKDLLIPPNRKYGQVLAWPSGGAAGD